MAAGARFGCVLADARYGSGAAFRQALSERGLSWAVGLSSRQTVYAADVQLTFPAARGGKPRKYHIPDQAPLSVADILAREAWRKVAWRRGTKGRLTCLFAARRVRIAEGHRHRMADNRVQPCLVKKSGWSANDDSMIRVAGQTPVRAKARLA
jgi:SRSO17 transposase